MVLNCRSKQRSESERYYISWRQWWETRADRAAMGGLLFPDASNQEKQEKPVVSVDMWDLSRLIVPFLKTASASKASNVLTRKPSALVIARRCQWTAWWSAFPGRGRTCVAMGLYVDVYAKWARRYVWGCSPARFFFSGPRKINKARYLHFSLMRFERFFWSHSAIWKMRSDHTTLFGCCAILSDIKHYLA